MSANPADTHTIPDSQRSVSQRWYGIWHKFYFHFAKLWEFYRFERFHAYAQFRKMGSKADKNGEKRRKKQQICINDFMRLREKQVNHIVIKFKPRQNSEPK